MGRKVSSALLTQPLNHVMNASGKLQRRYERLCGYKKVGLVRTGLRRRILGEYHYGGDLVNHEGKMAAYRCFLAEQKKSGDLKESA